MLVSAKSAQIGIFREEFRRLPGILTVKEFPADRSARDAVLGIEKRFSFLEYGITAVYVCSCFPFYRT
jgi:hypothetical protein